MSWFSELAGKAENLLNNIDEQTGEALRNHVIKHKKQVKNKISDQSEVPWLPRKRPIPQNLKNVSPVVDTRSYLSPTRRSSPPRYVPHSTKDDNVKEKSTKASPAKNVSTAYTLQNYRGAHKDMYQNKPKKRRNSLPTTLEVTDKEDLISSKQALEVENAILKSEITAMNQEISVLTNNLHEFKNESKINLKNIENLKLLNNSIESKKEELILQIQQLKQNLQNVTNNELTKLQEQNQELDTEVCIFRQKNKELEEKIDEVNGNLKEKEALHNKLENELKHSQSVISELQNYLEKSTEECSRLEKDWESYKVRVKNMLLAKDSEIKALRQGVTFEENNKMLMDQLENLKEEREALSQSLSLAHRDLAEATRCGERAESQRVAAERVATALRDALRDERTAKTKAEMQCHALAKELKALQMETTQTIAGLRNALYEKQDEINKLHATASSTIPSADTSALNVADYDLKREESEKIQYLTKILVQRQSKVDSLIAENNMLKIQLDKLERKYRTEVVSLKQNSIVNVQETDCRRCRNRHTETPLSRLSLRIGIMFWRHPTIRVFILIYMIFLHFWVLTVLFTNTPQDLIYKPVMSV